MPAKLLKISYPVPSDKNGHEFSSAEQLLSLLGSENSGQYLVGSQGMWHGGIHITDATVPWCALSADTAAEREYLAKNAPYKGGQFIRCMAEGKIVAWRVCKDYDSAAIAWRDGHVFQSTSFVLVEHYIQPGEKDSSGLTFHTLYMNMAPFEAYITEEGANQRKVAKSQRYYASKEDVLASPAKPAGTLPGGTAVTLSDNLITRGSDCRQFTQVTLSAEAKNTAGKKLAAGTPVWTVSDQGSLLAASSAVPVPSWWTKCSPAYGNQTGAGVQCTARTNWQFYLSSDDVLEGNNAGSLTAGFPLTYEPDNAGQQMTRPAKNKNEAARIFSLVTLGWNVGKMKKGDRVWVVSDGDSLTKMAQAAAGGEPKFGEVVIPATPVEINAGDSIGHMGFYELPEEDGKQSRYQVHIECLSMDSKLPTFLTNPDKVGGDSPTFLKYPEGANLFAGNAEGAMVDTKRVTRAPGILTLSGVPVIRADEVVTHYQIHPEGGWLPAANIIKLPQWALGDLGFVTLDRKPESFDLIDGKKQPNNVVKGILAEMYKAAKADPRTGSALYHYNYDRLLKQIDRNNDGQFSEEEYIQAIRLPAYRDHLYRIIAKHPSEWWYGKDDALWKKYLDTLVKDAPSWKTYLETFIDRLTWMKSVAGIGPDPWHMHPVVFLNSLKSRAKITKEMLRKLWRNPLYVSDALLNEVAEELSRSIEIGKINTRVRLSHFMAQVLQEVGSKFTINENLNYRPTVLVAKFSYYKSRKTEAESDGYIPGKHTANAKNIANKVYANRNKNGDFESGDGWKFRGRGMKQLTFRGNYRSFTNYHEKKWDERVDFEGNPDLLLETIYAVRSALYFWESNGLHAKADVGLTKEASYSITKVVNFYDDHYEDRFNNLLLIINGGVFDEVL
jgi:predicted chitinase